MDDTIQKPVRWQDWAAIGGRLLIVAGISLAIYLWRTQNNILEPTEGLALAAGISIGLLAVVAATIFVPQLEQVTPFALILADWVIAGIFINTIDATPGLIVFGVANILLIAGLIRFGPLWGSMQATGVLGIAVGFILLTTEADDIDLLIDAHGVSLLISTGLAVSTMVWVLARARYDYGDKVALGQLVKARAEQLQEMEKRASTITQMTDTLTGTLNFEKILNAALDIGLISVRRRSDQRVVSLVLLFRDNDRLYISDYRGLSFAEERKSLSGSSGAIAKALQDASPVVVGDPYKDPELRELNMKNMRSVVIIPLRAHYENYGVLIYGSEERNAFPPDHVHTLHAIGMQATVALQNAVLYNSLMSEKERIIQMEEDARKSLVRDLHDVPTQTISAVVMRLRIVQRLMEQDSPEVPSEIDEIAGMAQRATEEIRHVLFKLRPLALESQGLTAALGQLSDKMLKTYKQNMTIKVGPQVEQSLDETQQGALFYLIEEAVNNARKYAEAETIAVQIVRQKNIIAIRIADNGKGFDVEAVNAGYDERGSFGMVNMRERAELLNGSLNLKSTPGKGTTITVIIPIDLSDAANNNGRQGELSATRMADSARNRVERMVRGTTQY